MWWVVGDGALQGARDRLGLTRIFPQGSFGAGGYGGQFVLVIPDWDTIIVHVMRTGGLFRRKGLSGEARVRLLSTVLAARSP